MLIEFRVANHRSIREEQVLTLEVGRVDAKDDVRPRQVAGTSAALLPVAAIYGANASGKSNLLSALRFMAWAVTDSHRQWGPRDPVPRDPFAWGPLAPSVFEVTVLIDDVRHEYGFAADDDAILEEWLYAWPNGRKQTWFERDGQSFKFGEHLRGETRLIEQITRPNALFLSAAAQNQHPQLSPIYAWFDHIQYSETPHIRHAPMARLGLMGRLARTLERRSREVDSGAPGAASAEIDAVLDLLRAADVGITDIRLSGAPGRGDVYLHHHGRDGGGWLHLHQESSGTQALLQLASGLLGAIQEGGLFVIDELEASLHPLLGLRLVSQFNDPVKNPKNAQLLFSTHDTNLLGTTLGSPSLRRDQVWLTEKDDEGATRLYPLTDYKPRKAENLETGYLQGRYGAIPFLGDLAKVAG